MQKTALSMVLAAALAMPLLASAQATVDIQLGLPVVLPRMVVVSPGIQVVPGMEEEVFFTGGYYWARHDGGWYRSRSHRGGWMYMPERRVPPGLVRLPPGHYKHWRGPPPRAAPAAYRSGARGAPVVRGSPAVYHGGHDRGEGHGRGHEKKHGRD